MAKKKTADASVSSPPRSGTERLAPATLPATGYGTEETLLLHAYHLARRKIGGEDLSPVDRALLRGAAELFRALAETCEHAAGEGGSG